MLASLRCSPMTAPASAVSSVRSCDAILLDAEARAAPGSMSDSTGKLKEPLLRLTQLWRAFNARAGNGTYRLLNADKTFGEGQLLSPSVFNFFAPDYAPRARSAGADWWRQRRRLRLRTLNTQITNFFDAQVFSRNSTKTGLAASVIVINIAEEVALASNPDAIVASLSTKLLGGGISPLLAQEARAGVLRWPLGNSGNRVAEPMFLIVTSPEFASAALRHRYGSIDPSAVFQGTGGRRCHVCLRTHLGHRDGTGETAGRI